MSRSDSENPPYLTLIRVRNTDYHVVRCEYRDDNYEVAFTYMSTTNHAAALHRLRDLSEERGLEIRYATADRNDSTT